MRKLSTDRAISYVVFAAIAGQLAAFQPSRADDLDKILKDVEKSTTELEKSKRFGVELKGGKGIDTRQLDADVRRQKEDAAQSLKDTLKEIDERAKARAIEGGKGVIIQ